MFKLFKKKYSSYLGVDIGTTGIRIVQLGESEKGIELQNYAYLETKEYLEVLGNQDSLNDIKMYDKKIIADLGTIIEEANIDTKKVVMSIPASSAFSSILHLPGISKNDIGKAVDFEARRYIPIPIEEVVFDWSIIRKKKLPKKNKTGENQETEVLLIAISKETTGKYVNIAKALNLELVSLETEPFALSRCLIGEEKGIYAIVDIGNKTTSVTVIENGCIAGSHNISGTGGEEITKIISRGFNIDVARAEKLKIDISNNNNDEELEGKIFDIILPIIDIIVSEIKKINELQSTDSKQNIKKIILTGGTIGIPKLVDYFSKELRIPVETGNPWRNIIYNDSLSEKLGEHAPLFSIAVGLALRGFEK